MALLIPADTALWTGRTSGQGHYLHEKVRFGNAKGLSGDSTLALLGYSCDAGVIRNQGRPGAIDGPDAIRTQLAKMPNHLASDKNLIDFGNIHCRQGRMEAAQDLLTQTVVDLLDQNAFPLVLGGGHDVAYGHYRALRQHLGMDSKIGIINFDAHLDLRNNATGNNSGTPFYQIAQDCKAQETEFQYLCLGARWDANDPALMVTAKDLGATLLMREQFTLHDWGRVHNTLISFMDQVDQLYVTIDLDGFSSAYAPGVSAASPMGFAPDVALASLELIMASQKVKTMDLAEMNPKFDRDGQTAKLAAALVHFILHNK